jgi:hypothetical protein
MESNMDNLQQRKRALRVFLNDTSGDFELWVDQMEGGPLCIPADTVLMYMMGGEL